jgi:UDP-N-acetylmuramoyl-L-alanyl-D-glutamate--2,6-diaminopimelate ligase
VIVCEEIYESDAPYILVKDCRLALALMSAAWFDYPSKKMHVIGVTGTSGKTTTTHLIRHVLQTALDAKVGMIGTNGNFIGEEYVHTEFTTPDSFELQSLFDKMYKSGCSHVVMEVSSHSLSLERVAGVQFDIAAFTNLSQDHLDFHNTMEEYAEAKKKLFSMCSSACFNIDDAYAEYMMKGMKCPVLTSSALGKQADLKAEHISLKKNSVSFTASYKDTYTDVKLAIPGMFSVHNALTALSVCKLAGIEMKSCAEALLSAEGVKGRVEAVPVNRDYSVIIDYSHKPDALENVLKTLRPITKGKLIALFGCGGDRDREKRPIMGKVAARNSDLVIVTSDNPRTEKPEKIIEEIISGMKNEKTEYHVICDRIEAIHWALDNAESGDVILLAGKGHEDYQIIGHEKHHMDEREIVAEYLKEKDQL